ncbi:MAG: hypothetical protein PVJ33_03555 [Lysobacterales bacterium]|jgi:hypothetical protein
MNVLKNRHVVIAALVAPVLAVMSYYAIDYFYGERPHAARAGENYPLVEKPNCRYASGVCGLRNADFVLDLTASDAESGGTVLRLVSVFPLEGVKVALASPGSTPAPPQDMKPEDEQRRNWVIELPRPDPERDRLRLVASAGGTLYFGDVAMLWMAQGKPDPDDAR